MFYQASTTDAQLKSDLYGGTVEDRMPNQNEDFLKNFILSTT